MGTRGIGRIILAVGAWRVRREGWEQAEESHLFWDAVVRWLTRLAEARPSELPETPPNPGEADKEKGPA